jgi:hypothetical protein
MNRVDVFLIGGGLVAGLLLPFGVFFFVFCTRNRSCISQSCGYKLQAGPSKKTTEKQA